MRNLECGMRDFLKIEFRIPHSTMGVRYALYIMV